jgi:UDP:flavonoid glycosyltransferase YjiC (YdhE family)
MSEIVFLTWDGGGNVPPALGIAGELVRRGHRVRVLGHTGQAAQVTGAGLDFTAYPSARPFSSAASNSPFAVVAMFGDRAMGRDTIAELARRPADVVVVDCMLFGAMEGLAGAGVPYVVLEHLYDGYLSGPWLRGPIGLGLKVKRLDPRGLLDRARTRLVASLAELDPGSRQVQPGNVVYAGPVVTGRTAQPAEPTVLVSLSTYRFPGQTTVLQNILDAVDGLRAKVVVTTGPVTDPGALTAPAGVEVHRWLPHAEVLPHTTLVIGHGGHATTMAALAHDVPLLVLPMHPMLDQPMVGRSVQAAGAGRMLRKKSAANVLRPVIEELLAAGPHRAAAARLGAAIRATRGPETAADLVEQATVSDSAPR